MEYQLKDGEVQSPLPYTEGVNRIVASANKLYDGTLVVGARHYDRLMHSQLKAIAGSRGVETSELVRHGVAQGFIDKYGDFHSRTDAWKIAYAAGQIIRRAGGDTTDGGTLYSENLY